MAKKSGRERIVECVSIDDIDGTDDRPIRERGLVTLVTLVTLVLARRRSSS